MNTSVNDFFTVYLKLFCAIERVQVQPPWRQNAELLKEKVNRITEGEGKQPKKTRATGTVTFLSASLYVSRWSLVGCHARALAKRCILGL